MEIIYFEEIDSTQKYILDNLKEDICVWSEYQTDGIGSRGNRWIGKRGNLFFSFSLNRDKLPQDIPIQSISIYFMYQLKELLAQKGSRVKFKWPNDLYIKKKVGGCITSIKNDIIVCGIGVNTKVAMDYQKLDVEVDNFEIVQDYLDKLYLFPKWSDIFPKIEEEFYRYAFVDGILNQDGSLTKQNERIYSLR